MIKKAAALFCGIFIFTSFAAADGLKKTDAKDKSPKSVSMKKEKENYHKELQNLISRYDASSEEEKILIKNEVTALVAQHTEKELSYKKEKLAKNAAKAAKLEQEISWIESNKEAYINKETDFFLSAEGRKKLDRLSEKKDKPTRKKSSEKK